MSDFRKLRVWQKAHAITLLIYRETQSFPQSELYGLVSQMRRCCVSLGSNIAEGCGRSGEIEKARFFQISLGSLSELEYQMIVSRDLGYLSEETSAALIEQIHELGKMLGAFAKTIKAKRVSAGSQ